MSNKEIVDRSQILGNNKVEFDKSLRGYDTAQVDEYISNLITVQKNASENFDNQVKDLRNTNSMLEYEVNELKEQVKSLTAKNEFAAEEKERLMKKINEAPKAVKVVDDSQLKELQEKYDSLVSKHRLLGDENRKLSKENEDLKRDVAHLTKKVDKNRSEINNLRTSAEENYTNVTDERFIQISRIYEDAIDKCEDLIFRLQTELSLAHSKAEDIQ